VVAGLLLTSRFAGPDKSAGPIERFSVSIGGSGLLRPSMTGLRRLLDDPPYLILRGEI
jgi:hypothetical protein